MFAIDINETLNLRYGVTLELNVRVAVYRGLSVCVSVSTSLPISVRHVAAAAVVAMYSSAMYSTSHGAFVGERTVAS